MGTYTVSLDYIHGIKGNKNHLVGGLFRFTDPSNGFKASMDKSKQLLAHYRSHGLENNDMMTWLDWMSRDPNSFEIVDVSVPVGIDDESLYLSIAAATQPVRKVIVSSHQFWRNHTYIDGCTKIAFGANHVTVLDKEEAYRELNPPQLTLPEILTTDMATRKNTNPWVAGSFFLTLLICIAAILIIAALKLPILLIPVVIVGMMLLFSVVGAFLLRTNELLSDKTFLELMGLTFKQITFIRKKQ